MVKIVLALLLLALAIPATATPLSYAYPLPDPWTPNMGLLLALETPYPDTAMWTLPLEDDAPTGLLEPFPGTLEPTENVAVPEPTTILLCVYGLLIVAAMAKLRRR
jgi:hypothetical protein